MKPVGCRSWEVGTPDNVHLYRRRRCRFLIIQHQSKVSDLSGANDAIGVTLNRIIILIHKVVNSLPSTLNDHIYDHSTEINLRPEKREPDTFRTRAELVPNVFPWAEQIADRNRRLFPATVERSTSSAIQRPQISISRLFLGNSFEHAEHIGSRPKRNLFARREAKIHNSSSLQNSTSKVEHSIARCPNIESGRPIDQPHWPNPSVSEAT